MVKSFSVLVAIGIGFVLLACSSSSSEPTPTDTPGTSPTSQPTTVATSTPIIAETVSLGVELYRSKGCAACHGQDAEGTMIAPALNGHSASQVKRQARAPLGIMPVFPPDKISNEELDAIAEFIEGLEGGHAHVQAPSSPDEVALHHWMALFSLDANDPAEAIHHLGHIIDLTEGQHEIRMREAIDLLEQNEIDEAAHVVQEMLAGLEQADIDESSMHLNLALSSTRIEEADVAIHHLEHFLEVAIGEEFEESEHIIELLREGRIHDAEDELEKLLGEEPLEEHDDEEEPHDDDEEPHDDDEDDHEAEETPSPTN